MPSRVVPAVVRTELIMASQALIESSASLSALTLPSWISAFGHRSRAFKPACAPPQVPQVPQGPGCENLAPALA